MNSLQPWIYFDVVVAGHRRDLKFFLGRSYKCLVLYTEFLHAGAIELPQETHDTCLLARSRRAIDQQVGKVTALNLYRKKGPNAFLMSV